jgi:hypothetical protein
VATDYIVASITKNPYIWGAWIELAFLIMDRKRVNRNRAVFNFGFLLIFVVKFTGSSFAKLLDETFFYWTHFIGITHE